MFQKTDEGNRQFNLIARKLLDLKIKPNKTQTWQKLEKKAESKTECSYSINFLNITPKEYNQHENR